eukprot:7150510-Pyramimonas_sp.AAC.1
MGNKYADAAARSAAEAGRIAAAGHPKLQAERCLVDGVAMWCSAAGSWVQGSDARHRKAQPQGAVEGRAVRKEDASNTRDLRGTQ